MKEAIIVNTAGRIASVLEHVRPFIVRTVRVDDYARIEYGVSANLICPSADWEATKEFFLRKGNVVIERD